MVIFEDLHWIDGETQGFPGRTLSEGIASASIALLVNYRPEYRHEWGGKTYYTQLRLTPLGEEEAGELLTFLMGDDPSLKPLKALILDRTDGTPFFMEEVVQTLAEEGVLLGERGQFRIEGTPSELHISPTVQGVLAARIDRLEPDEKGVIATTRGRLAGRSHSDSFARSYRKVKTNYIDCSHRCRRRSSFMSNRRSPKSNTSSNTR